MARVVYVNGVYSPYAEASVHVEDRGFQFADGVYEVCEVRDGCLVDERRHMLRLRRSLSELGIAEPMDLRSFGVILRETVRRNRVRNGIVYLQVTRGVARRDFAFPAAETAPTVVCLAHSLPHGKGDKRAAAGIAVITLPDIRWARVDIKTTGLLAQSLARQQAKDAGADEAWMVDGQGFVTEGASCNAWIVTEAGQSGDAAGRFWYSPRHHPGGGDGHRAPARSPLRGTRLYGRRGKGGYARLSRPRLPG